jgi:hypothetical protein
MIQFSIKEAGPEVQFIYALGESSPIAISKGSAGITTVEFYDGLCYRNTKIVGRDGIWYFQEVGDSMYHKFTGTEINNLFRDGHTIEELFEILPENIVETMLYNLDIFRRVG